MAKIFGKVFFEQLVRQSGLKLRAGAFPFSPERPRKPAHMYSTCLRAKGQTYRANETELQVPESTDSRRGNDVLQIVADVMSFQAKKTVSHARQRRIYFT